MEGTPERSQVSGRYKHTVIITTTISTIVWRGIVVAAIATVTAIALLATVAIALVPISLVPVAVISLVPVLVLA